MATLREHILPNSPIRALRPDEARVVFEVHATVVQSLDNPSHMYARNLSSFEKLLTGAGSIIGAFQGKDLVGYMAITCPGVALGHHARLLQGFGILARHVSEGAGSAVLPAYRRMGLYSDMLRERLCLSDAQGAFASTIVSLDNFASLQAFVERGHVLAGILHDADGPNFLLMRPPGGLPEITTLPIDTCDLDDRSAVLNHLQTGNVIGVVTGTNVAFHKWRWSQS